MSHVVNKRAAAKRDLADHARYIAQDNPEAALRFLEAAEQTFAALARMPGLGAPWTSKQPLLEDVRRHPIKGFGNYLIFYRPIEDGIELLHVFHGARNIPHLLDEEDEEGA